MNETKEKDQSHSEFFRCACHCCGLSVELFDWGDLPESKRYELDFSFWHYAYGFPETSFSERIKSAWEMFRKGKICGESVIVKEEDLSRLIQTLQTYQKAQAEAKVV